jgi:hypothetical protein
MSRKARSLILVLALLAFPDNLWHWLTGSTPGLAAVWDKEGSDMDPNGLKAGSDMDPDGRVIPSPATTDAGIEMDPDG